MRAVLGFTRRSCCSGKTRNTEEALKQLANRGGPPTEEQVIAMLILSPQKSDHEQALERLQKHPQPTAILLFRLGHKFWLDGDLQQAIGITEKSLQLAEGGRSDGVSDAHAKASLVAKIKNSLAYFYAEHGDLGKADKAHRYSREALETIPNGAELVDTLGVVQIVFGRTSEEVDDGVKNCFRSAAADQDYIHFARWLGAAIQRKNSLAATPPDSASEKVHP